MLRHMIITLFSPSVTLTNGPVGCEPELDTMSKKKSSINGDLLTKVSCTILNVIS